MPVGLSRKLVHRVERGRTSPSAGARRSSSRVPASVGVTLRVVRLRSRTPSRASSRRTASLSVEAETPRTAAAPRKLRCARDRGEGVEIGKVRIGHCAKFRTACSDNAGLSNDDASRHNHGDRSAPGARRSRRTDMQRATSAPDGPDGFRPRPRLHGHVGHVRPGGRSREHRHHPRRARRRHHAARHRRLLRHGPQRDADRRGAQGRPRDSFVAQREVRRAARSRPAAGRATTRGRRR